MYSDSQQISLRQEPKKTNCLFRKKFFGSRANWVSDKSPWTKGLDPSITHSFEPRSTPKFASFSNILDLKISFE